MENAAFELEYEGKTVWVQPVSLAGQTVFRIGFPDKSAPLVITRAIHANAYRFWTSVPEGRQREAEALGALIAAYFKMPS